ncbi:uncharacterized protein LOC131649675 [Vicia villosa]|uniref:uncharacterized protein LOC131649675 n=1 Tax=Vicia villosa TaxID=3911 RepID=UPI00273C3B7B|nr:uncharacterized protein LOC131649675 [Vicia villosa]
MERWKEIPLSKEEEEGVTIEAEEEQGGDVFERTLAGKLWTENRFNSKAFISTITGAWKLRNPIETQELSNNLFLFRFSTKRDLENVMRNGPWSFDRYLLVLDRVSGEEQPSDLKMHYGEFWVRIYELPLMLRSEAIAQKMGNIIGEFVEMDMREAHRNGRFLRVKAKIDLKSSLKRGTVVRFKGKNLRVYFKYERLPTFCFVCGRLGHQIKDCEEIDDLGDEGYEDLEEQELSYGAWLRASPLPRTGEEQKKKESSSSTCSKSLFSVSSSQSRCDNKTNLIEGEVGGEGVIEKGKTGRDSGKKVNSGKEIVAETSIAGKEIEAVAESLGAVGISNKEPEKGTNQQSISPKKCKKWTRKQTTRKVGARATKKQMALEMGKRQLVDVMIVEGTLEDRDRGSSEKKLKSQANSPNVVPKLPEVVLEDQHRLHQ